MVAAQQELVNLFIEFFKQHPSLVITNLLFLFIIPIDEVVMPHFYGKIMDAMTHNSALFKPFLHVITFIVSLQIMYTISEHHDAKFLPYLQSFLGEKIVQRVLENYQQEHTELEMGELNIKLAKLPVVIISWFERVKNYIIPYLIMFFFAIIYFMFYDVFLAVGLLVIVMIFILLFIFSPLTCLSISTARDKCFNYIHEIIDDIMRNLFSVFGSNQEGMEIKTINKAQTQYSKLYGDTLNCVSSMKIWTTPLVVAYLIFFASRCYTLIRRHQMSSATFVPLFIVLLYILNAMRVLTDEMRDITVEWGMITGSSDILVKRPVKQPQSTDNYHIPEKGIGFRNITFTYPGTQKKILKDVTLHISPGERVCIVGDIGSGKSTLIKLLLKYHIQDQGDIYYDGRTFQDIPLGELRRRIGYVPQQPSLFNRTVMENILYGNGNRTRQDVESITDLLGIREDFEGLEHGFDTKIGKNGSKLSGGQRQLVWCLRVLMRNPDIIILDEPTASIDEKTKVVLHTLLNNIMQDKTVIMITHDPFLVDISTRLITMKQGQVIGDHPLPQHRTRSSSESRSS